MIDRDYLHLQTAGDMDLQRELLSLFLQQLEDLRDHLGPEGSGVAVDLCLRLHRVRGAAAAVGAQPLVRALTRAEVALDRDLSDAAAAAALRVEVSEGCVAMARLIGAMRPAGLAKGGESR